MEQHPQEEQDLSNICSVLQILGAKWAFLIIAELSKGPKRFNRLNRNLAIVKTQSLSNALRHLEDNGIVLRQVFPTVPVTVEYSLTEKGMDFKTALQEMERWAARWKTEEQAEEQNIQNA